MGDRLRGMKGAFMQIRHDAHRTQTKPPPEWRCGCVSAGSGVFMFLEMLYDHISKSIICSLLLLVTLFADL